MAYQTDPVTGQRIWVEEAAPTTLLGAFTNAGKRIGSVANAVNPIGPILDIATGLVPGGASVGQNISERYTTPGKYFWEGVGSEYIQKELLGKTQAELDAARAQQILGKQTGAAATTAAEFTPPAQMTNVEATKLYYDLLRGSGGGGGGGYVSAAQQENARRNAAAQEYWNRTQQYGQAQSNAILDLYKGLAQSTARTSAQAGQRGLDLAANIEQLYQSIANQGTATGAEAGMVTPETGISGITPISGAAATAAQQLPTAGASLGQYLQGQQGIQSEYLNQLALQQARQGASQAAEITTGVQAARIAADYQRRMDAISRISRARANESAAAASSRNEYNKAIAEATVRDIASQQGTANAGTSAISLVDLASGLQQAGGDYGKPAKSFLDTVNKLVPSGSSAKEWAYKNPALATQLAVASGLPAATGTTTTK